jgi:hypothetical protein
MTPIAMLDFEQAQVLYAHKQRICMLQRKSKA